jgi:hypothetical protein
MPSAHSRRKRLGCVLAVVGLIAVIVAACSKHDSPTGPNTALIQGQKPLSIPVGRPPHHGKPEGHGPFGNPPFDRPPFTPPGPPPWHDAELQSPAETTVALETGSGGVNRSVSLFGVLMIGVAGVFVQQLGGRRRRK